MILVKIHSKIFPLNPNGNVCLLYFPDIRQLIHKLGKCNKICEEIEKGKKLKNKRNYLKIYEYNMCLSSLTFLISSLSPNTTTKIYISADIFILMNFYIVLLFLIRPLLQSWETFAPRMCILFFVSILVYYYFIMLDFFLTIKSKRCCGKHLHRPFTLK